MVKREGNDHPAAIHVRVETLERASRVSDTGLDENGVRDLEEIRRTCRDLAMVSQDCAHALDLLAWAYGEMWGDRQRWQAQQDEVRRELAQRYGTWDHVEAPW